MSRYRIIKYTRTYEECYTVQLRGWFFWRTLKEEVYYLSRKERKVRIFKSYYDAKIWIEEDRRKSEFWVESVVGEFNG